MTLFMLLFGCKNKPEEMPKVADEDFSVNNVMLSSNYVGVPDYSDTSKVYQATKGQNIVFELVEGVNPDVKKWYIEDALVQTGVSRFQQSFNEAGLYQIKFCSSPIKCIIKYLNVIETNTDRRDLESERAEDDVPIAAELKIRKPHVPKTNPAPNPPPPPPVDTIKQSSPVPPVLYNNSSAVGMKASDYRIDCVSWTESSIIHLKVKDWCELHSAAVYGSGSGKLKIQLTNGDKVNETMIVTLNPGKTNFSFAGLDAELQPGMEYTLRITTMSDGKGDKPKIGNISKCGSANGSTSSVLSIDYGSDLTLFDLKYKY